MSLAKGKYVFFNLETTGFSNIFHHIVKISAEVLAPNGTRIKNGKFQSLVRPPGNIPPIITQLTGITDSDVEDCQAFLVVGKYFTMFLKDNLDEQGEIQQRGASHIIFVSHNGNFFT